MSYEKRMLEDLQMPLQQDVELALLQSLFKHNGVIKEFSSGEKIVEEIADFFNLNSRQRTTYLETTYKKENRLKKSYLWHRLLFRAADSLAREKLISRPTQTVLLTHKKEWMLTEAGYDQVLNILHIPLIQKNILSVKSYEVQKIIKKFFEQKRPDFYSPFDKNKKTEQITRETKLRNRAFRQSTIEAYDFACAVCGMKIYSPKTLQWEVEAAHIVPHCANGKDDILNGLALCSLHHWAFDCGWFTLTDDLKVLGSKKIQDIPPNLGKIVHYDFMRELEKYRPILLPNKKELYPHINAIKWHRENIFTT